MQLSWDRNSYGGDRKFTFHLNATAADIRELLSVFTIMHLPAESPKAIEVPSVTECVMPFVTPSLKRTRIQKKLVHSSGTLSKYSEDIETKLLILV